MYIYADESGHSGRYIFNEPVTYDPKRADEFMIWNPELTMPEYQYRELMRDLRRFKEAEKLKNENSRY
jgi:hypothetical protein